jgi:hypothetical protein
VKITPSNIKTTFENLNCIDFFTAKKSTKIEIYDNALVFKFINNKEITIRFDNLNPSDMDVCYLTFETTKEGYVFNAKDIKFYINRNISIYDYDLNDLLNIIEDEYKTYKMLE